MNAVNAVNAPQDPHLFTHLYGRIALRGAGQENDSLAHVAVGTVSVYEVVLARPRDDDEPAFGALCMRFTPVDADDTATAGPAGVRLPMRRPPTAGNVAVVCHGDLPHPHDPADAPGDGQQTTRLDAAVVDTTQPHAPPPPGRFRDVEHLPVARDAAEHLDATVACLHNVLELAPWQDGQPSLLLDSSARLLSASLLGCMPRRPDRGSRGHTTTLQRAIGFIHSHAEQPLTLADVAAAAHVTARALQYAFAHIDTTPLAYLRDVRLTRAHTELQRASPATDTVTDIALRWGFAHPGRFAAYYRAAYGISPSTTLLRAPPPYA
ncbi:helix-turn-helix domain-containing protein [Streptomyces luteocolor]|uniref:helix-turn-helix domain-containing protein n=1 Tax=Streptomyces luteocolor TaxID=285500 RepID=UPI000852DB89|nr:helix-turn-helix domain-containing protein [Streptomyces luteocolor]